MTLELHEKLRDNAPNWRMALIMELCRETRRRMNSVRNLLLTDLDLADETVTWRAAVDKARKTTTTALTPRAVETIRRALELRQAEGVGDSAWLFPAPKNPEVPVPETSLHNWMKRARNALGIKVKRLGYHGEKRAGIRDPLYQQLPEEWREAYSGTTIGTEKRVYGFVGKAAMRQTAAILSGRAPAPVRLGELQQAA
jgi:integrase